MCVPVDQCGCRYNGQIYELGSSFIPEGCEEMCECLPDRQVNCTTLECDTNAYCGSDDRDQYGCHCSEGFTGDGIICKSGRGMCKVYGDPHYVTFDGVKYDFQGVCSYTLMKNCRDVNDNPPVEVIVENVKRDPSDRVSFTKTVIVHLYGTVFEMMLDNIVYINGTEVTLPVEPLEGVKVIYTGRYVRLVTDFGMRVTWDSVHTAFVNVPSDYFNATCGLCGNFDGNDGNDYVTPDGQQVDSIVDFADSWISNSDECALTTPEVEPCEGVSSIDIDRISQLCGIISDPGGPFKVCHERLSPIVYQETCIYDVCEMSLDETFACGVIETYAQSCLDSDVLINIWRNDSFCPMQCPQGSTYAINDDPCPETCAGKLNCTREYFEGCVCEEGKVWDDKVCVNKEDCGCIRDGYYYSVGDTFVTEGCSQECTCYNNRSLICDDVACHENSTCAAMEGVYGCHCKTGFVGSGVDCAAVMGAFDIVIVLKTSISIHVSWSIDISITTYMIQYLAVDDGQWTNSSIIVNGNTRFILQGLHESTTYQIRIVTFLGESDVEWSSVVEVDTCQRGRHGRSCEIDVLDVAPFELILLQITGSSISLSWTLETDVQSLTIENSKDGLEWADGGTITYDRDVFIMQGLEVNTRYIIRIRAVHSDGAIYFSVAFDVTTCQIGYQGINCETNVATYASYDLTFVQLGSSSVFMTWSLDIPVVEVLVQYRISSSGDSWINGTRIPYKRYDYVLYGLVASTTYSIRVVVLNDIGVYAYSTVSVFSTCAFGFEGLNCEYDMLGDGPFDIVMSQVQSVSLRISWSVLINARGFIVQKRPLQSSKWDVTYPEIPSFRRSFVFNGLFAAVKQEVQVIAVRKDGSYAHSRIVTVRSCGVHRSGNNCENVAVDEEPYDVTMGSANSTSLTMFWTITSGLSYEFFYVQYRIRHSTTWVKLTQGTSPQTSDVITGLQPETSYEVQIVLQQSGTLFYSLIASFGTCSIDWQIGNGAYCDVAIEDDYIIDIGLSVVYKTPTLLNLYWEKQVSLIWYIVQHRSFGVTEWIYSDRLGNDSKTYAIGDLQVATTYDILILLQFDGSYSYTILQHYSTCEANTLGPQCEYEFGVFRAWGGNHYMTFDGKLYDFNGECQYTLVDVCNGDDMVERFSIILQLGRETSGDERSYIKHLQIHTYGWMIIFERGGAIQLNDSNINLPFEDEQGLTIGILGDHIVLETDFLLNIKWDRGNFIEVEVFGDFKNTTCGLAGNFDGMENNDFITPNQVLVDNAVEFANSWVYDEETCNIPAEDFDPCENRTVEEITKIVDACSILSDATGPFRDCLDAVDYVVYNTTCVYDYCALFPDNITVCDNLEVLAYECMQLGIDVYPWRTDKYCPLECPEHSEYTLCTSICEPTCDNPTRDEDCDSQGTCVEGCSCDDGYVREENKCIQVQECGCVRNGYYYKVNEKIINSDCTEECVCENGGTITCRNVTCDVNAVCGILNGTRGCRCNQGFDGDGYVCDLAVETTTVMVTNGTTPTDETSTVGPTTETTLGITSLTSLSTREETTVVTQPSTSEPTTSTESSTQQVTSGTTGPTSVGTTEPSTLASTTGETTLATQPSTPEPTTTRIRLVFATSTSIQISFNITVEIERVTIQIHFGDSSWQDYESYSSVNMTTSVSISGLTARSRVFVRIKLSINGHISYSLTFTFWTCDEGVSGPECGPYTTAVPITSTESGTTGPTSVGPTEPSTLASTTEETTVATQPSTPEPTTTRIRLVFATSTSIQISFNITVEIERVTIQIHFGDSSWQDYESYSSVNMTTSVTISGLTARSRVFVRIKLTISGQISYSLTFTFWTCDEGVSGPECGPYTTAVPITSTESGTTGPTSVGPTEPSTLASTTGETTLATQPSTPEPTTTRIRIVFATSTSIQISFNITVEIERVTIQIHFGDSSWQDYESYSSVNMTTSVTISGLTARSRVFVRIKLTISGQISYSLTFTFWTCDEGVSGPECGPYTTAVPITSTESGTTGPTSVGTTEPSTLASTTGETTVATQPSTSEPTTTRIRIVFATSTSIQISFNITVKIERVTIQIHFGDSSWQDYESYSSVNMTTSVTISGLTARSRVFVRIKLSISGQISYSLTFTFWTCDEGVSGPECGPYTTAVPITSTESGTTGPTSVGPTEPSTLASTTGETTLATQPSTSESTTSTESSTQQVTSGTTGPTSVGTTEPSTLASTTGETTLATQPSTPEPTTTRIRIVFATSTSIQISFNITVEIERVTIQIHFGDSSWQDYESYSSVNMTTSATISGLTARSRVFVRIKLTISGQISYSLTFTFWTCDEGVSGPECGPYTTAVPITSTESGTTGPTSVGPTEPSTLASTTEQTTLATQPSTPEPTTTRIRLVFATSTSIQISFNITVEIERVTIQIHFGDSSWQDYESYSSVNMTTSVTISGLTARSRVFVRIKLTISGQISYSLTFTFWTCDEGVSGPECGPYTTAVPITSTESGTTGPTSVGTTEPSTLASTTGETTVATQPSTSEPTTTRIRLVFATSTSIQISFNITVEIERVTIQIHFGDSSWQDYESYSSVNMTTSVTISGLTARSRVFVRIKLTISGQISYSLTFTFWTCDDGVSGPECGPYTTAVPITSTESGTTGPTSVGTTEPSTLASTTGETTVATQPSTSEPTTTRIRLVFATSTSIQISFNITVEIERVTIQIHFGDSSWQDYESYSSVNMTTSVTISGLTARSRVFVRIKLTISGQISYSLTFTFWTCDEGVSGPECGPYTTAVPITSTESGTTGPTSVGTTEPSTLASTTGETTVATQPSTSEPTTTRVRLVFATSTSIQISFNITVEIERVTIQIHFGDSSWQDYESYSSVNMTTSVTIAGLTARSRVFVRIKLSINGQISYSLTFTFWTCDEGISGPECGPYTTAVPITSTESGTTGPTSVGTTEPSTLASTTGETTVATQPSTPEPTTTRIRLVFATSTSIQISFNITVEIERVTIQIHFGDSSWQDYESYSSVNMTTSVTISGLTARSRVFVRIKLTISGQISYSLTFTFWTCDEGVSGPECGPYTTAVPITSTMSSTQGVVSSTSEPTTVQTSHFTTPSTLATTPSVTIVTTQQPTIDPTQTRIQLVFATSASIQISFNITVEFQRVTIEIHFGDNNWQDYESYTSGNIPESATVSGLTSRSMLYVRLRFRVSGQISYSLIFTFWTCEDGVSGTDCGPYTTQMPITTLPSTSATTVATTTPSPPGIDVSVTQTTGSTIRIQWTVTGGGTISSILVQYSIDEETWTDGRTVNSGTSATVTNLSPRTRYFIRLQITFDTGVYTSDIYEFWTCPQNEQAQSCGPYTTTMPPTTTTEEQTFAPFPTSDGIDAAILLIEVSNDTITVKWEVRFEIEYVVVQVKLKIALAKREIPADGNWHNVTIAVASTREHTIIGLQPGTDYEIRLLFIKDAQVAYSEAVIYKTCETGDLDPSCGNFDTTPTVDDRKPTEEPLEIGTPLVVAIVVGAAAVVLTMSTIAYLVWRARNQQRQWAKPEAYGWVEDRASNRAYERDNDDESEETARVRADSSSSSDLKKDIDSYSSEFEEQDPNITRYNAMYF
ncbi:uncharacterized protein LOC144448802 [Glandiceps talaboti]